MNTLTPIDPDEFVALIQPLLKSQDAKGLIALVRERWSCDQVMALLGSPHADARKVALLAVALVGGRECVGELAGQLRDEDKMVNQLAEHALWSVWFRGGTPQANHLLFEGTRALDRRDFDEAVGRFDAAVEADPEFAEAYNQRALARYLRDEFEESIADCREAVRRMPCHFGAWSGMGHCHAHLRRWDAALEAYREALRINPHLECVREAVCELERRAG